MTEKNLGASFSHWIGEVTNVKDPDQSGRVQVRIYGKHDDKTNVKDEHLPWALPLQPVTSAAFGKIGTAPLGLVKGSKVMGYFMDKDQQYPVIMGSFGKAGDPVEGETENGIPKINTATGSIPGAATNSSPPLASNPFSKMFDKKVTINDINFGDGGDKVAKYNKKTGVVNNKKVDEKLKEPKKPTTASAKKGDTSDVLDILKQVDPNKTSRAIPGMADGFNNVRGIMNMTSPMGLTNMLSGSLEGVIQGMAGQIGFGPAMALMGGLAASGTLKGVAQNALKLALANTAVNAAANAGIPISNSLISTIIPGIDPRRGHPRQQYIVTTPGPTYVQQYYPLEQEPYPGYIEYRDVTTNAICYKLRGNEPYYPSAQHHIRANSSQNMLKSIGKMAAGGAISDALGGGLTGAVAGSFVASKLPAGLTAGLGKVITSGLGDVAAQGIKSILGNGVTLGNISSLASKLLPKGLSGGIGGVLNGHLPTSVLDPKKIGATMGEFTKNQSLLAVKKKSMLSALSPSNDIDAKLAYANDRLAASEVNKLGPKPGSSEIITYNGQQYKVTYG